jgi:hypothetical protein
MAAARAVAIARASAAKTLDQARSFDGDPRDQTAGTDSVAAGNALVRC